MMKLYCIEFERELEDKEVLHVHLDHVLTKQEAIDIIHEEGFGYDDDYGRLTFYEVKQPKLQDVEPTLCKGR